MEELSRYLVVDEFGRLAVNELWHKDRMEGLPAMDSEGTSMYFWFSLINTRECK